MMRVTNHGGRCCGIKHILSFPHHPSAMTPGLPQRPVFHGAHGEMVNPGKDFYPGPNNMERASDRLKKLIEYVDSEKDSHLVEVVLQLQTAKNWKKELNEYGFRQVTEFWNSNTYNTGLIVFHRVTRNGKVVLPKKEK